MVCRGPLHMLTVLLLLPLFCSCLMVGLGTSDLCHGLNCEFHCEQSERGSKCICAEGYELNGDGKTCRKIDYCIPKDEYSEPRCSQTCISHYYNAVCHCVHGYTLADDGWSCKVIDGEGILYYTTEGEIWALTMDSRNETMLINDLNIVNGLAVDSHSGRVFWTERDNNQHGVHFVYTDSNIANGERHTVLSFGLVKPMGLDFDFITGNLYIADMGLPAIIACELKQKEVEHYFCAEVFNSSYVESPRDIALHPAEGFIYWTEVGDVPAIMMGGMDGFGSEVLVHDIRRPLGLDLDFTTRKLFWVDAYHVYSINLNGSNKKVVNAHRVKSPMGMVVFEDEIIWANQREDEILAASKFEGSNLRTVTDDVSQPTALAIQHKSLQDKHEINHCYFDHECHLCLQGPEHNKRCICSAGSIIDSHGSGCLYDESPPFLLATNTSQIIQFHLVAIGSMRSTVLKTSSMTHISAIVYLSESKQILYSDVDDKGYANIKRIDGMDSDPYSVSILTGIENIQSLAVDESASTVYWVNSIKKAIEVSTLKLTWRINTMVQMYLTTLPVSANHPVALTLNPKEGILYFVDLYPARIQQCKMDGTSCLPLVTKRLEKPNDITYSDKKLFWSDESLREISCIDLKTKNIEIVVITRGKPISVAISNGVVYWTEAGTKGLFYKHIEELHGHKSHIDTDFSNLKELVISQPSIALESACSKNNGGCDHICISGQDSSSSCLCFDGYFLNADGKSCTKPQVQPERSQTCEDFHHCDHICNDTRTGPKCTCKNGFRLVGRYSCQDINECMEDNSICSQTCENLVGAIDGHGFKCQCQEGYGLNNFYFCKAKGQRPVIFFSSSNGIGKLSVNGHNDVTVVSDISPSSIFDIDMHRRTVFWVEMSKSSDGSQTIKDEIWKKSENDPKQSVFSGDSVHDIAVDWITSNVYISHAVKTQRYITVLSPNHYQAKIVAGNDFRPGQIALHPSKGWMFWVSENRNPARLLKSMMDGSRKSVITDVLPHRRNMLALDPTLDRIYWYDLYSNKVVSGDLNGAHRHHFDVPSMKHIYSFDIFEGFLYMTDVKDNSILRYPLFGVKDSRQITEIKAETPKGIKVSHPMCQPYKTNLCDSKPCLYMCVLTVNGATCLCPDGYREMENPKCDLHTATPNSTQGCALTCQNGGECFFEGTKQTCRCGSGFSGDLCEVSTKKTKKTSEEESKIWIIGVVLPLIVLLCLVIGAVSYLRNKRYQPNLMKAICFKKSPKYIVTTKDDAVDLVPEISFNNPGFQDEIDEEADMQKTTEWWRKLIARSHKSVDDAFHGKVQGGKCPVLKGGMPQDPMTGDQVSLLKKV